MSGEADLKTQIENLTTANGSHVVAVREKVAEIAQLKQQLFTLRDAHVKLKLTIAKALANA